MSNQHRRLMTVPVSGIIGQIIEPWVAGASCNDEMAPIFFPPRGASSKPAKQVCAKCPVRVDCLEYAIRTGQQWGIWGGTTGHDRRKIRTWLGIKEGKWIHSGLPVRPAVVKAKLAKIMQYLDDGSETHSAVKSRVRRRQQRGTG